MPRTVPARPRTRLAPNIREDFLRLEQNWLQLARSYEVAQQIVTTGINGSTLHPRPD